MTNQWMGLWENDLRSRQRIIIQIVVKHYIQSLAEIESKNLEGLCVAFLHLKSVTNSKQMVDKSKLKDKHEI